MLASTPTATSSDPSRDAAAAAIEAWGDRYLIEFPEVVRYVAAMRRGEADNLLPPYPAHCPKCGASDWGMSFSQRAKRWIRECLACRRARYERNHPRSDRIRTSDRERQRRHRLNGRVDE